MATLYIVATPIGNLGDITLRALEVLGAVDVIACEDTRITSKLLARYEIRKPLVSYHAQSGEAKVEKILTLLREGKDIALVSDSGTPTISDPGVKLVSAAREQFGDVVQIVPIPGPNAAIAALSASGIPASEFLFLGFLPHKKGREKLFTEIAGSKRTVVFYESPHRILKTLKTLAEKCWTSDVQHLGRRVVVARELTKIHEEIIVGTAEEVLAYFEQNSDKVKGEFVVIVSGG